MLEDKDIEKLLDVFATKEDFYSFREEMRNGFSDLQALVDAYTKKADTYFQEIVMLAHKVDRHEKWLLQLAQKFGIKLEY